MDERTFEDIICTYPELIDDNLSFKGRQVSVKGKRVDVLFEDRYGQQLIIEIKKDAVKREHVGQLFDYEGHFVSSDNPNVRVMLVGNIVPENFRRSLDHHGIEWRELTIASLINFLRQKRDFELLSRFTSEEPPTHDIQKPQSYSSGTMKDLSTEEAMGTPTILARTDASHSRNAVEGAVALIREEYLKDAAFHSVRCEAEAKAKEMLDNLLGRMLPADIGRFLGYVNTESIKGKKGLTRFERHFTNILARQIAGCPNEFNQWIGELWRTEEYGLQDALARFLTNRPRPVKGAGTLLPTFVLYLRRPTAFNIYTETLAKNLARVFSIYQPARVNQYDRYAQFNHQVFQLLVTPFGLAPQEVDLILSKLPHYLPKLSPSHRGQT